MTFDSKVITDGITNAYQSFYNKIEFVNNVISASPKDDSYSAFWSIVSGVSETVTAVAISLACIYGLISFIRDGINFKGNWEGLIKCLIKLIIAKGLIENSTDILLSIYKIGAQLCSGITKMTESNISDNLQATIPDNPSGLFEVLFSNLKYFPFEILLWFLGVIIVIVALGRFLQVLIFIMFAPISFAQFAGSGFHGIINFLKDYFAVCLQGGIIMAAMSLFTVLIGNKDIFGKFTDSYIGDLGLTIVFSLVLIKILISSQSMARKFLG